jgi:asparagine synthase (glutamine-hydrolysing)
MLKLKVEARIQPYRRNDADIMSAGLAERARAGDRRLRMRRRLLELDTGKDDRARILCHPYLTVAQERYCRVAASVAMERRDPYMDLRLVEWCCRLPLEQLQANGWPKAILRRAMADVLPQSLVRHVGRDHLGWQFTKALWSRPDSQLHQPPTATIRPYVNLEAVPMPNGTPSDDAAFARWLNSVYLGNWLESATVAGLTSDGLE